MTTKPTQRMRRRLFILSAAFGLLLTVAGGPVLADTIPEASPQGAGLQASSWILTIPYGAVKAAYAIGGGIVGGFAWALSGGNMEVGKSVWIPSMTGDYIVQPQHLTREKTLHFVGRPADEPAA